MIAYNNEWLKNLLLKNEAATAFEEGALSLDELNGINDKYQSGFYTPNFFIRTGLFILTLVIAVFSFGLISLLMLSAIETAIGGMAIFVGLLSYGGLEYMAARKNHYRSGVDDALLWIAAACIFGGLSYSTAAGSLLNCVLVAVIALVGVLRFANRLMAVVLYVALMGVFFYLCTGISVYGRAFAPFILMAISACAYFICQRMKQQSRFLLYADCLQFIVVAALLGFYIAGNYFIVRELSNEMFGLNLPEGQSIPFGWVFWIFTICVPVGYLVVGICKKDPVLIRVALLLVAALVFTVKYYYHVASIEVTMAVSGIVLLIVAYGLSVWLQPARFGFTSVAQLKITADEKKEIESLAIAQTFSPEKQAAEGMQFGGGGFGGGGSAGDF